MKWYCIILILLSIACRSNTTVTEDEISADIFYAKGSYKPFSGKCTVLYNNTNIVKTQFTFRDGLLNGEAITWYKNGQIRRKGNYSKGLISGRWTFFDERGNKIIEANYKNDSLNGSYTVLFSNGKVKEKGEFYRNKQAGKWVYYNEKGDILYKISH
jgi:antitoxin component YwqK of YwqJK toxin-antitoxin module